MSFFSAQSEAKQKENGPVGFWQDGVTRRVTISEEWRPSKKNPDKQVRWLNIHDVDTFEDRANPEFTLQTALSNLPDGVNYDNMIIKVTPVFLKVDEAGYDRFDFTAEATGEYVAAASDPSQAF